MKINIARQHCYRLACLSGGHKMNSTDGCLERSATPNIKLYMSLSLMVCKLNTESAFVITAYALTHQKAVYSEKCHDAWMKHTIWLNEYMNFVSEDAESHTDVNQWETVLNTNHESSNQCVYDHKADHAWKVSRCLLQSYDMNEWMYEFGIKRCRNTYWC